MYIYRNKAADIRLSHASLTNNMPTQLSDLKHTAQVQGQIHICMIGGHAQRDCMTLLLLEVVMGAVSRSQGQTLMASH